MILLYHKVDNDNKTVWWVSSDQFYRQLIQLRNKKVVYLDDYDPQDPSHVVITFDGIYQDVLRYAAPLLKKFNYPFELFVTGDTIGQGNEFDAGEPYCRFADRKELQKLIEYGGRLQWHTKTHTDISKVDDSAVEKEVLVPEGIKRLDPKGFKWFGYAYGRYDDRSQALVKKYYKGGLACDNGTFKDKTIWPRVIVDETTQLIKEKVSVIITSYNYGHFLVEAIESVLRQTYLPDEILLSDDASTDHGYEIMKVYAEKYPDLITINRNPKNLGIEKHFNKAVGLTKGDLICFLGADNRLPSNYIEESLATTLSDDKIAIAYTDFALFGSRAEEVQSTFLDEHKGKKLFNGVYLINFPSFSAKAKKHLLEHSNFINGSSMYRREAYSQAGGYKSRSEGPEDYTLFKEMIRKGWEAKKVENVYLEYRQHSTEQANSQFSYFTELAFLKQQFKEAAVIKEERAVHMAELDRLNTAVNDARQELATIKGSRAWKVVRILQFGKYATRHPVSASKKVAGRIRRNSP